MSCAGALHVDGGAALRRRPGAAWRCAKKRLASCCDGELDEHNLTLDALEALLRLILLGVADASDLADLAVVFVLELLQLLGEEFNLIW